MKSANYLWYSSPAAAWTQALPIGNGTLGAMVWGGVKKEVLDLNHDTLWTGYPRDTNNVPGCQEALKKARELAIAGKYHEAQETAQNGFESEWSQAYMPLGKLLIDFDISGTAKDYSRSLDLSSATAGVDFTCKGSSFKRQYIVSYPDKVIAARFTSDKEVSFTLRLTSQLKAFSMTRNDMLWLEGEAPSENSDKIRNEKAYYPEPERRGMLFAAALKLKSDGKVIIEDNFIRVENARSTELFLTAETSFNGFDKQPYLEGKDPAAACEAVLSRVDSFEKVFAAHKADFTDLYGRVTLDLGESEFSSLPTDKRLRKFAAKQNDPSLYTLMYNYGRYLTIASSRPGSQPSNLQGIWNDKFSPPWNANYTVNINTEMNYWPVLMCRMPETLLPLIEMVKELSVTGAKTAEKMYGAPGFVSHHNVDLWRLSTPVPGNSTWSFWPGSSGWLCRHVYEYYEYTLDKDYLKNTAYPLMKKAAEFYLSQLAEDENGYLFYPAGTSPEHDFEYEGHSCAIGKYSTMLNTIIRDLFGNCIKAAEVLGKDKTFAAKLARACEKIVPFATGSEGQLLEWNGDFEDGDIHHRHVSHLYALHPANIITADGTPELADACRKTLARRGDNGTGWSLGWKINFWARLFDGDHALKLIKMQLRPVKSVGVNYRHGGGTYENLFDAHPPFQIDGNFGFVSGVTEMLMQSRDGKIYILPALPSEWKNGSVKGLLAKGNIIADIEWKDGKLYSYSLKGEGAVDVVIDGKTFKRVLNGKKRTYKAD